ATRGRNIAIPLCCSCLLLRSVLFCLLHGYKQGTKRRRALLLSGFLGYFLCVSLFFFLQHTILASGEVGRRLCNGLRDKTNKNTNTHTTSLAGEFDVKTLWGTNAIKCWGEQLTTTTLPVPVHVQRTRRRFRQSQESSCFHLAPVDLSIPRDASPS
ncbi:unnamed protein product, partial [Ectocarpus sp. 12 AP-2014]